ncbi:MAG: outer membrane protein assembly factor BamB family protein [Planctomycetota bacterium]
MMPKQADSIHRLSRFGGQFTKLGVVAMGLAGAIALAAPLRAEPADESRKILSASGVKGGLVVHIGCGDGRLTTKLRVNDSYLVHGLDARAESIEKAREQIEDIGLYGQVAVDSFDGTHLPYIDNLVNLVVSEDLGRVSMDEVMRVLCPDGVALTKQGGQWVKTVKPRPKDIDDWTHFLHSAAGNAVADDSIVGVPFHLQWVGGPRYVRTHEGVATVNVAVSDGRRIYYIADDSTVALPDQIPAVWTLVARDAFNGVILWKRPLNRWQAMGHGSRHNFPPDLFRRLVAAGSYVYATLDILGPVAALDPATGKTVRIYENTEAAEEILYDNDVLYVIVNTSRPEDIDRRLLARELPASVPKKIVAFEAKTGRLLWRKNDRETVGLVSMSAAVKDGYLVFQNADHLVCLDTANGAPRWQTKRQTLQARPVWATATLVIADDVVLSADYRASGLRADSSSKQGTNRNTGTTSLDAAKKRSSELIAYDLASGRPLWSVPCEDGSHVPNEVFVVNDLVWVGQQPGRSGQDYRFGRDIHTGRVKATIPPSDDWVSHHHHRCYRDKATSRFILAGRTGVEFIDLESGRLTPHHWIRGICKTGVLPCNGLLYLPPNQCNCYQESLLNGFNALAPKKRTENVQPGPAVQKLEKGPAYGKTEDRKSQTADSSDWATYRHDASRSGSTAERLAGRLDESWRTQFGGRVTAPVIAAGQVFVAAVDRHTVYALDSGSGKIRWSYTAGGRVDSPPTVADGFAVFGCRDGWVYALRATDGTLAWRYQAVPDDRRLVAHGQCESVWPVHGSVLIENNRVYFAAGRYSHLDGGVVCSILDLKTGRMIVERRHYSRDERGWEKPLYEPFDGALLPDRELPGVKPDVPASDGTHIFMCSVAFNRTFEPANKFVRHLFSSAGFLDDAWYQRSFWIYGNHLFSGLAGRGFNKGYPSAGRLLVHDDDTLYGYRDYTADEEGVFAIEKTPDLGVFDSQFPPSKRKLKTGSRKSMRRRSPANRWRLNVPFYVRAMIATGDSLLLAGPPKHEPEAAYEAIAANAMDTIPPAGVLKKALEAWQGKHGGRLWVVNKQDGDRQAEYELRSPPVHDGMAAANGRLYISGMDGSVICYGGG